MTEPSRLMGRVLGRLLAHEDGLAAAYLPHGVSEQAGEDIVRAANQFRGATPPYAILVTAGTDNVSDPGCLKLTSQSAIQYRQGSRLAVVVGRHPDLASFIQAFREVLGQDFPNGTSGRASLVAIASEAVDLMLSDAGKTDASYWNRDAAVQRLASGLADLSRIQENLRQGTKAWNALWFENACDGFDRLQAILTHSASHEPELSLDDVFERYTYAAFGLPRPAKTAGLASKHGVLIDALEQWWSDEDQVQMTVKQLDHHPETFSGTHSLSQMEWKGFDQTLAAEENTLSAFIRHGDDIASVQALAGLTEGQFVDPQNTQKKKAELVLLSETGQSRDIPAGATTPFLLETKVSGGQASLQLVSETVRIKIPTLSPVNEVDGSQLTLSARAPRTQLAGVLERDGDGGLYFVGHLVRSVGKAPFTYVPKPISIGVEMSPQDPLAGKVDDSATCTVILRGPDGAGMLYWPEKGRSGAGKISYLGPEKYSAFGEAVLSEAPYSVELQDVRNPYKAVLWAGFEAEPEAFVEGTAAAPLHDQPNVWWAKLPTGNAIEIMIGEQSFQLTTAQPKTPFESPVVAAVHNQQIGPASADPATQKSVRGAYESFLSSSIGGDAWEMLLRTLGHVAVPVDGEGGFEDLLPVRGLLMGGDMAANWPDISDFSVPADITESVEADEFRHAFKELGVGEAIEARTADGVEFWAWPSRSSWRHLWDSDEGKFALHRYLDAYASLVEYARQGGNAESIFWATYPFSISAWKTEGAIGCQSVLLSPLHPVRLAWLAGVESTLWHASKAEELAGTVEGWNIPLIGPRDSENGKMIAVPTDSGKGQVFLGWSMLVEASVDGPAPLLAPRKLGSYPAPGNAASGLNATAAAAALRNYRKMNPHVSTLTVDLAAGTPTTRLSEVDDAVLSTVKEWAGKSSLQLTGGARIWDSLNRGGEAPREAVTRLVRESGGIPLTWSRYQHSSNTPKVCNIRILQDSGVRVGVGVNGQGNYGVMGRTPLRRLEAYLPPSAGARAAESHPALRTGTGWEPFTRALMALEGASVQPKVTSKLFHALLVNKSADWTVSGEALMSPSAMAELIKTSSGNAQMLWEWRPPFLEKGDVPVLERRPFVSVTRVPPGFRDQIRSMLAKAQGAEPSQGAIDELLGKLGARGVGLSSLLSMGGTHAAGALGFYLAFALMDLAGPGEAEQFVLPIDACDTFLRALSGGAAQEASNRRADLLVLGLDDTGLTLTPIEIKFYGLGSNGGGSKKLPSVGHTVLNEAVEQLASTMALLGKVKSRWDELRAGEQEADRELWANAMATLVETGVRLSPRHSTHPNTLADRLQNVALGEMQIQLGKPLITYFLHDAETEAGEGFETFTGRASGFGEYGALVANAGVALSQVEDGLGAMNDEWASLLKWSATQDPDAEETQSRPAPAPASIPEPGIESGAGRPEEVPDAADKSGTVKEDDHQGLDPLEQAPPVVEPTPEPFDPMPESETLQRPFKDGIRGEGVRFPVGRVLNSIGNKEAVFWPGNTALNQMNVGVVGDLGTGKTQLLKALITQLRSQASDVQETPVSTLVFDYKRDFQDEEFLSAVGGRVLRPQGIPLNIFALPNGYTKLAAYQRATAFTDILAKIYSGVGPVQRERLVTVITKLYEDQNGRPPTLSQILDEYREVTGTADSVTSMLSTFVLGEIFSDDPDNLVPFGDLLEDTVLVVALSDLGADQNAKNALVVLFLNMYYDYKLQSRKWPYADQESGEQLRRLNSFLLVDEAVNIMRYDFPVLMDIMLQGREFGFGVILASQYLSHFKNTHTNYGEPLLTWFIHKVPNVTPRELEQLGFSGMPKETAERITKLKVHEALYKSLDFPGVFVRGTPFYEINK
ncbi:ATP-binding protein [Arthrobacter sp. zg-Y895]|uniref:ATP-binding protein n=1 Tax=Arthrobacter sp. zg-Y895 TaxID=2886933 RepID=UPI001D155BF4|nr:hypothetical protein [Arthrobacter sp. zg-Y895]MCC3302159.1 hypothetical protein [Arthrobacter sp. zg-Y895]